MLTQNIRIVFLYYYSVASSWHDFFQNHTNKRLKGSRDTNCTAQGVSVILRHGLRTIKFSSYLIILEAVLWYWSTTSFCDHSIRILPHAHGQNLVLLYSTKLQTLFSKLGYLYLTNIVVVQSNMPYKLHLVFLIYIFALLFDPHRGYYVFYHQYNNDLHNYENTEL